jgi:adenylate cyclase
MKSFIQSAVSLFEQGIKACHLSATNLPRGVIVPGYNLPVSEEQQKLYANGLDRRMAGILYADIADYARLTEEDEEGTQLRLIESMRVMKEHIALNGGRVANSAGDAILAEFKDADSALHCAISVQLAARQWNANFNFEQQVRFRVGVNFGDVTSEQGDIYGNAVTLAARLEVLACSGGICVSDALLSQLEDHSEIQFVAMGKQYVKNISKPIQAFWIEVDSQYIVDFSFTGALKIPAVAS